MVVRVIFALIHLVVCDFVSYIMNGEVIVY